MESFDIVKGEAMRAFQTFAAICSVFQKRGVKAPRMCIFGILEPCRSVNLYGMVENVMK